MIEAEDQGGVTLNQKVSGVVLAVVAVLVVGDVAIRVARPVPRSPSEFVPLAFVLLTTRWWVESLRRSNEDTTG